MCAWFAALGLACAEEPRRAEPGVLSLDVTDEAAIEGSFSRGDAVYHLSIETVGGEHHLWILEPTSRILLALQARQTQEGEVESFAVDWTATDVLDEADLAAHHGFFGDLGAAARTWGMGAGRGAPAWIVPLLELPSHLTPPPIRQETVDYDTTGGYHGTGPLTTATP